MGVDMPGQFPYSAEFLSLSVPMLFSLEQTRNRRETLLLITSMTLRRARCR